MPLHTRCISQGATKAEALENIKDAIRLCIDVRAERGMPLTVETAEDDFDREVARTRANEKLMAFLDKRAEQQQTVPLDEGRRRLGL